MNSHINKMQRNSDSLLTSIFARTISTRLTPLVAKTRISPLQVTLVGFFLGILAAWQACLPNWKNHLLAALLLELSHVLDCIDGELARLTKRGSPFAAAMDPITDRIKDMIIIYAAYIQAHHSSVLNGIEYMAATIAYFTAGFWALYMYIVDAYLNPVRKKNGKVKKKIYLGLYDLFIYGALGFLLFGIFEYFNIYILILAISGISIQLFRLKSVLR